jgi:preprotein translocase subunit YajC
VAHQRVGAALAKGDSVVSCRDGTLDPTKPLGAPDVVGTVTATPTRRTVFAMGELTLFVPLIIGLAVVMYLGSRRQKKAMQATIDLQESLSIGDRVHTTSGLEATIAGISDDSVDLEIAPGVVTTWMKLAVRDRITPEDEFEDDDEDDVEDYEQDVADDAYDVRSETDSARSPKTDS